MPPEWSLSEQMEFVPPTDDSALIIYEQGGVTVKTFRVNHDPVDPAVGYRIEFAGKVVVISGDTIRTTSLLAQSQNADLLVCDAMNKEIVELMEDVTREIGDNDAATILYDIRDYHLDVNEVGPLAQEANVQRLALTHLAPLPPNDRAMQMWFKDPVEAIYTGELFIGEDGLQIIIPVP
jgi:ribonuclease Z